MVFDFHSVPRKCLRNSRSFSRGSTGTGCSPQQVMGRWPCRCTCIYIYIHDYICILYVYIYIICMYIHTHIFLHTYSYKLERTFEEHLFVLVEFLGHRNHRGEPDPQQSALDVGASISLSSEDLRRCRLGRIFGFPNLGFNQQRCGISTSRQWVLANRDWDWSNQKKSHLSYQEKDIQQHMRCFFHKDNYQKQYQMKYIFNHQTLMNISWKISVSIARLKHWNFPGKNNHGEFETPVEQLDVQDLGSAYLVPPWALRDHLQLDSRVGSNCWCRKSEKSTPIDAVNLGFQLWWIFRYMIWD